MTMIRCVYCDEQRPHSDEHILQKGLGGNLTFKDVCRQCNSSFSVIDQTLTDYSVVALSRLVETPVSKQVARASSELIYDPDLDLWKEVRVGNQLAVEVLPQLHYRTGEVVLAGNTVEPLRAFVVALEGFIKAGKHQEQRIKVDEDCGTPRIAMRREGQFLVRAPALEIGKDFLQKLVTNWTEIKGALNVEPRVGTILNPKFQGQIRLDLNASFRAVAKSVFNYLAYRRGVPYARQAAFAEVREYIRGNVALPEPTEGSLASDPGFVTFAGYGKLNLIATETHSVVITTLGDKLCGILTLYGKHTFIVALGQPDGDFLPLVHEFSIDGSWNRELTVKEMIERRLAAATEEANDPD